MAGSRGSGLLAHRPALDAKRCMVVREGRLGAASLVRTRTGRSSRGHGRWLRHVGLAAHWRRHLPCSPEHLSRAAVDLSLHRPRMNALDVTVIIPTRGRPELLAARDAVRPRSDRAATANHRRGRRWSDRGEPPRGRGRVGAGDGRLPDVHRRRGTGKKRGIAVRRNTVRRPAR